ncbi:MAG: His/Gly/Thr/Pro-type tRNA ligase C-terminal domain-containing protein, partial [Flavobacteriaceae bacterium]|nr:His/Gly/Thr/Pro-type tRNA ligase C-terminal domain-containing protein [Flavobacteriaceae bacterium]
SLEDQTVTLRERDSMKQERIAIAELKSTIEGKVSIGTLLRQF